MSCMGPLLADALLSPYGLALLLLCATHVLWRSKNTARQRCGCSVPFTASLPYNFCQPSRQFTASLPYNSLPASPIQHTIHCQPAPYNSLPAFTIHCQPPLPFTASLPYIHCQPSRQYHCQLRTIHA